MPIFEKSIFYVSRGGIIPELPEGRPHCSSSAKWRDCHELRLVCGRVYENSEEGGFPSRVCIRTADDN